MERAVSPSAPPQPVTARQRSSSLLKIYLERPELAASVLLVMFVIAFEARSGGYFLSLQNLRGVLGLLPEVGMVGIGVTILMICGEFDLSVGSVFALAPMAMTLMMNAGIAFLPAILISLVIAAGIGAVNGLVTLRFGIPSFITTLGMMFMARSITVVISGGFPPLLPDNTPAWVFTQFIGPHLIFRLSFLWFLGIALLAGWMMSSSNLGNWIKATGGHLEAAISMGIPTWRVKVFCFVLCATLAGFAGIIQVLRLGSPLPSIGEGLELQAIAAAVIGGAALTGGIGTVGGAIVGAMLVRAIDNGLVMTQVDANWFGFAIGLLTILAVIGNTWLRRTARKIKVTA
jgi:simple sugar transport system permease protein